MSLLSGLKFVKRPKAESDKSRDADIDAKRQPQLPPSSSLLKEVTGHSKSDEFDWICKEALSPLDDKATKVVDTTRNIPQYGLSDLKGEGGLPGVFKPLSPSERKAGAWRKRAFKSSSKKVANDSTSSLNEEISKRWSKNDAHVSKKRDLRLGRDARDSDVLSRFSTKLQQAMSYHPEIETCKQESTLKCSTDNIEAFEETKFEMNANSSVMPKSDANFKMPFLNEYETILDLNKLAALAMKAKLKGDTALQLSLTDRINSLKAEQMPSSTEKTEDLMLINADDYRKSAKSDRVELMKEDLRANPRRKGKLSASKADSLLQNEALEDFLRRERIDGPQDMDANFVKNVIRLGDKYKGTELGDKRALSGGQAGEDEEDEIDMRMFEKNEDRLTNVEAKARERNRAIHKSNQQAAMLSSCKFCLESRGFSADKCVSHSQHVYLQIVIGAGLSLNQHCLIVPSKHVQSVASCEEEVCAEIDAYKKSLKLMAGARSQGIIFLETVIGLSKSPHACIDAVAVPIEVEQDAALYFKQALLEAADEWSTHKKIIPYPLTGGIRRVVPKQFAYFSVEWGAGGGYVHIIEREDRFPRDFGRGVIAGMMGIDPPKFNRKGNKPPDEMLNRMVSEFQREWEPHNWVNNTM